MKEIGVLKKELLLKKNVIFKDQNKEFIQGFGLLVEGSILLSRQKWVENSVRIGTSIILAG